ncbi:hypothetical protein DL93DRAFT_2097262 [Clavulina sp. PMI_390]|nr:hypothetical protein DL93DRAFT_2097262 [Clavulina sp. PMI_390]
MFEHVSRGQHSGIRFYCPQQKPGKTQYTEDAWALLVLASALIPKRCKLECLIWTPTDQSPGPASDPQASTGRLGERRRSVTAVASVILPGKRCYVGRTSFYHRKKLVSTIVGIAPLNYRNMATAPIPCGQLTRKYDYHGLLIDDSQVQGSASITTPPRAPYMPATNNSVMQLNNRWVVERQWNPYITEPLYQCQTFLNGGETWWSAVVMYCGYRGEGYGPNKGVAKDAAAYQLLTMLPRY